MANDGQQRTRILRASSAYPMLAAPMLMRPPMIRPPGGRMPVAWQMAHRMMQPPQPLPVDRLRMLLGGMRF